MRVLVLGGDGYLGWPTAMHLAARGHTVCVVDNYLRRTIAISTQSEALMNNPNLVERASQFQAATGKEVLVQIADCSEYSQLKRVFREFYPDAVVHYAEQPSAPYSMRGFGEARQTLNNNLNVTFNLIWCVVEENPDCHIVKLGTMGEYGTPNIDIEEGWLEVHHKGRSDTFLYPRQAGSLYHTTKVLDTDLLWFYVRLASIRVTDLMQGPVYGLSTDESDISDELLPNFHYDDIFGTVVNRFLVQAIAGIPLTVYGRGGQTRGYLNLKDTLQCIELAISSPPDGGEFRILNQFTEQFTVNQIGEFVVRAAKLLGLNATMRQIENPRKELEDHYYNAAHSGLLELGLKPHLMSEDTLAAMMEKIIPYRQNIDKTKILPRVRWA